MGKVIFICAALLAFSSPAETLTRTVALSPENASAVLAVPAGYALSTVSEGATVSDQATMAGVELLRIAGTNAVTVTFTGAPAARPAGSRLLRARIRATVANPEDVGNGDSGLGNRETRRAAFAAVSGGGTLASASPDMVILSPPDYVDLWMDYAEKRRAAHSDLTITVANTTDIYAEYPFGSDGVRNAAESIHKYLRTDALGADYVLLGGAWIDAQNVSTNRTFLDGTTMSLSNCVPGVIAHVQYSTYTNCPSDMIYACLDLKNQTYPWCVDDSTNYYEQANNSAYDSEVDLVVARFPLKPMQVGDKLYTAGELLTNYIAKLERAEGASYTGAGRLGDTWNPVSGTYTLGGILPTEYEFYDDAPNTFSRDRATEKYNDDEPWQRSIIKEHVAKYYPVRAVDTMNDQVWTRGCATSDAAVRQFYSTDHDYVSVDGHGWNGGSGLLSSANFKTATGIVLFNDMSVPCDCGEIDNANPSVAETSVLAPNGGALTCVANTSYGWATGNTGAYRLLHGCARAFLQNHLDAGNTWSQAHLDLFEAEGTGGYAGFSLVQHTLFGDPLVAAPVLPTNIVFTADTNTISGTNAYLTATCDGDLTLGEATSSSLQSSRLKILQSLTLSGTSLTIGDGVEGGIASVTFTGDPGTITIESTGRFYLGAVTNCTEIIVKGSGTIIDGDRLDLKTLYKLTFNTASNAVNTLRSTTSNFTYEQQLHVTKGTLVLESGTLPDGALVYLYEGGTVKLGVDPTKGPAAQNTNTMTGMYYGTGSVVYPYGTAALRTGIFVGYGYEETVSKAESEPLVWIDFPAASASLGLNGRADVPSLVTKGSAVEFDGGLEAASYTDINAASSALMISSQTQPYKNKQLYNTISKNYKWSVLCVAKPSAVKNGVIWNAGSKSNINGGKSLTLVSNGEMVSLISWGYGYSPVALISASVDGLTDNYHSILVTYDPAGSPYFALYIDGALASTRTDSCDFDAWSDYADACGYQLGSMYGGCSSSGNSAGMGSAIDEFAMWYGTTLTADDAAAIAAAYPYCGSYEAPEPEPESTPSSDLPEPYIWYEFNGTKTASSENSIAFGGTATYTTGATNGANTALNTTAGGGHRIWGDSGADFGDGAWSLRLLAKVDSGSPTIVTNGLIVASFGNAGKQGFALVKCGTSADPQIGVKRWGDGDESLYLVTSVADCASAFHDYVVTASTNGILRLYIDGVCTNKMLVTLPTPADVCQMGNLYGGSNDALTPSTNAIDDFRIYHQALTATQVAALAGLPVAETPDYTNGYITTSGVATGWKNLTLAELAHYGFSGTMNGGWVSEGTAAGYCISNDTANARLLVQMQMKDGNFIKAICLAFYLQGSEVYAKALWCRDRYTSDNQLGDDFTNLSNSEGNPGIATSDTANGYGIRALTLTPPTVVETASGDEIVVDANWLAAKYPDLSASSRATKATQPAANSRFTVAECYVLGLDPTDATADFTITIAFDAAGAPVVTPYLGGTKAAEGTLPSGWKLSTQGKTVLTDDWSEADTAKHHFFRAVVAP